MTDNQIRFDDGAAYERYMGAWSQLAGEQFLDWLAPAPGLRWLDVGCGNGAFTEMVVERCSPADVFGIDPSEQQLSYARARLPALADQLKRGDAMALPFADKAFDVAVMPLVIFFVPDPAVGVAEMARVLAPGGIAAAYAWDMAGGGFPYQALQAEMRAMNIVVPSAPSPAASSTEGLHTLWANAGFREIEESEILVQRTFADFNDYWTTVRGGPSVGQKLASLAPDQVAELEARLRTSLPADAQGRITYSARANAIHGRTPA